MGETSELSGGSEQLGPREEFLLSQLEPDADIDKERVRSEITRFVGNLPGAGLEGAVGEEALTAILIRDYFGDFLSPEARGSLNTYLFQAQMKSKPLIVYNLAASGIGKAVDHYFGNPDTPFSYHLPGEMPYPLANELLALKEDQVSVLWNDKFNKQGNPQMRVETFTDPDSRRRGIWMSREGFAYSDRVFQTLRSDEPIRT